jgi:hypothetical protein
MHFIDLGHAAIRPDQPVVAGSFATLRYTYTAGHPIDDTGYVKIAFRYAGDFGRPQFDRPSAPNYCRVHTTGDCRIEPRWDPKGHTRPWGRAILLKVTGGFLDRAQEIVVILGDRSHGSPGWQMQTFCEDTFEFKTLVDPIATYQFKELPRSPALRIVPGDPVRAVCIAPSQVIVGQPFAYHLKLEDRWGNPTARPTQRTHPAFPEPGIQVLTARDVDTGLSAQSNPIDVRADDAARHPYWADLHGQSEETIGTNSIDDYFRFARDYGLVDISAHQGNDFQVTDALWRTINARTAQFYERGAFVTFPGYEWSGNTPLGGDRNIYFTSEGGQIVHSSTDLLPDAHSAHDTAPTATELFRRLGTQQEPRAFACAHVGGRYADLSMHDPEIEWAVEVHSAWGTFDWLVTDALQRGYRIGICANSDGHKCRPGASYPGAGEFGSFGGLTCVWAWGLDRQSVVDALQARHVYATTGNRCLVDVKLVAADSRSAIMGDVIRAGTGALRLLVRAIGTAPIESVRIYNGSKLVSIRRPYGESDLGNRIKIVWSGAEVRGRARMVAWDGHLHVKGNALLQASAINFWNPGRPLDIHGSRVEWKSITTGGTAGMILTLSDPYTGSLELETPQGHVECSLDSIGYEPRTWHYGGVRKQMDIYRLPHQPGSREFSFALPLGDLHKGDNPIYIRMTQEDGHMAWTSPIYVIA